ncbi:DUF6157 family protein [Georgenia sp. MJ206]|uniref:DUF6157 family protein n=1 Tax=Georgenia wangjunii TaxID=3117730 RepID=UPI002F2617ED
MGTTNYRETFIAVAEDCPAAAGTVPTAPGSVAALTYELISAAPYTLTSDDVLFTVHAVRKGIAEDDRAQAREEFFAKPQACLRASPLGKTYGWGVHHDAEGRVALYGVETERYAELAAPGATGSDGAPLTLKRAMRRSRA